VAVGARNYGIRPAHTGMVPESRIWTIQPALRSLTFSGRGLVQGTDTALDACNLAAHFTDCWPPQMPVRISYGSEPGGPGNVQIRAFDVGCVRGFFGDSLVADG